MAIEAIQKNNNKTHRASYVNAAAGGALSGYALKHILPLNQQEKEDKSILDNFVLRSKKDIKESEINAIRSLKEKTPAQIEALKIIDEKKFSLDKFKKYEETLKTEVLEIFNNIQDTARAAKKFGEKGIVLVTKGIRPTNAFVIGGAGVAIAATFIYNILGKISKD